MNIAPVRTEKVSLDDKVILEIPFFNKEQVPDLFCARYARLSAEYIFGVKFPVTHAWKMRNHPQITALPTDNVSFKILSNENQIERGSIVGVYVPKSQRRKFWRHYTHLSVYLGEKDKIPVFLEQFGDKIRISNLTSYDSEGLKLKEILTISL